MVRNAEIGFVLHFLPRQSIVDSFRISIFGFRVSNRKLAYWLCFRYFRSFLAWASQPMYARPRWPCYRLGLFFQKRCKRAQDFCTPSGMAKLIMTYAPMIDIAQNFHLLVSLFPLFTKYQILFTIYNYYSL